MTEGTAELERLYRAEWGRLLSALIRDLGDFDFAEEVLQEAFASALLEWSVGVPSNPRGWLFTAARHNAIDQLRRRARLAQKHASLVEPTPPEAPPPDLLDEERAVPDERLRLIFTCCHPALSSEAQVALTLRALCGLTTEEIAHAFLVPVATMAQRLVRAKAKIRGAGIPYSLPSPEDLPERLVEVMAVLYLVFNEGYAASQGGSLVRGDLCAEAIRMARLLRKLLRQPVDELDALLALMLLHDARRAARVDGEGAMVLLPDQDRRKWDRAQIEEGRALLGAALRRGPAGPYAIEAAIAAVHAEAEGAEDTDWRQIASLYQRLYELHASPVVALNHAVAVSMADGPRTALPLIEALEGDLAGYHLWHAARADLLRRLERPAEAIASYRRAHSLARNDVERSYLERRMRELSC